MRFKQAGVLSIREIVLGMPAAATLILIALQARADSIVAEYNPAIRNQTSGVLSTDGFSPGQTFTPIENGKVTTVTVLLQINGQAPAAPSVPISITATAAGLPTTTLASTNITFPSLTATPANFTADFSFAGTSLVAGQVYAIVLGVPPSGGYQWVGNYPGSYAGGQNVYSLNAGASWRAVDGDSWFAVSAVPEPPTALLLISYSAFACWSHRARR